jgi:hypothetical protein
MEPGERADLEEQLVASYESYVALKSLYRQGGTANEVYEALVAEEWKQRYLHALLGYKGEPAGLLY